MDYTTTIYNSWIVGFLLGSLLSFIIAARKKVYWGNPLLVVLLTIVIRQLLVMESHLSMLLHPYGLFPLNAQLLPTVTAAVCCLLLT